MPKSFVGTYRQGSREVLDYTIDWSAVMTAENSTIIASEWFGEEGTPTIGDGTNGAPAPTLTPTFTVGWIVNGTVGDTYHISNVVTDSMGRKHEASIFIEIIDK